MSSFPQLWTYFEKRAFVMLKPLQRHPIVWQETFETTKGLPLGTVVEVWKGAVSVHKALEAGMDVILAYGW